MPRTSLYRGEGFLSFSLASLTMPRLLWRARSYLCILFKGQAERRVAKHVCRDWAAACLEAPRWAALPHGLFQRLCRHTVGMQVRTELATPWSDFTLEQGALFLRFTYSPQDCTPANLHKSGHIISRQTEFWKKISGC